MTPLEELTDKHESTRFRRTLFWARCDGSSEQTKTMAIHMIKQRWWLDWGYPRLFECLVKEFNMPLDTAVTLTA